MGCYMQQPRNYRDLLTPLKDVHITKNVDLFVFFQIFILTILYFCAAKLGLSLSFQAEQVTVVWPPTGIALAAILLFGFRIWPGILLGAFLTNITANETLLVATGIAIGNTLEAIIGAALLKYFTNFSNKLNHVKDVIGLVIFAAIISTAVAATIGVTSLCLGGIQSWDIFGSLWLQWWLGDASGALVVAPLLIVWGNKSKFIWQPAYLTEAGILLAILIITSFIVFIDPLNVGTTGNALIYIIFPFIIWSSLRFDQRTTTCITLTTSLIAVLSTIHGFGPFSTGSLNHGLVSLQIFMMIVSVTGLLLGAAINERVEAENSLRENRELTKLITDYVQYAIITTDKYGKITEWNKQAENIFGWTEQEALGKNMVEFIIPPKHLNLNSNIKKFFAEQPKTLNKHIEVLAINKDGNVFPIELTNTHQKLRESDYFTTFIRSIAEQKLLEETKGLLAAIIESSDDSIVSQNLDGIILSWNSGAERILGYTAQEAIGKHISFVIPPDKDEEEKQILSDMRSGKRIKHFETTRLAKDGRRIDISLTTSPIRDATGQVIGTSKIARDITERKKTEAKLSNTLKELIIAKKKSEEANLAKSQFLANMSHEIRTPINGIIGMTELLFNTNLNTKQDKYARTLVACSNILLDLVNEILDLSKIEAKELILHPETISLKSSISQILQILTPKAKENNVELKTNFINSVPDLVIADSVRLHQILLNITNNAIKFTHNGHVVISIININQDKAKVRLRFEVQDTGIGIPKDKQEEVFKEFTQVDNSSTRKYGGTGLGLSICKKLVTLMGGEIGVISDLGKGSTFWFEITLPICDSDKEKEYYASKKATKFINLRHDKAKQVKANVLVVEDISSNLYVIQEMLEKTGCIVDSASDGKIALDMLEAQPDKYHCIFMDCQMPNMDGYETTRVIRSKSWSEHIPIIAVTAHALYGDRTKCMDAGMNDYISKPIRLSEVERVVSKYLC
jgi:PAS domain S-box-containing protein